MNETPVNRLSLRDQVTPLLREAILTGEFDPGQRLIEPELAKRWNVSLTPIREALVTLAGTGLVVRKGRRGTYVRVLLVRDVENLMSVRETLEILAVRQATPNFTEEADGTMQKIVERQTRATEIAGTDPNRALPRLVALNDEFHQVILQQAGNEWLTAMLASIKDLLEFSRTRLRLNATLQRRQESLEEHRRIMEALRHRDSDAAARHMSEHVIQLKKHVIPLLPESEPENRTHSLDTAPEIRTREPDRAEQKAGED